MDHFKGSEGGRTLPLLHPGGRPNVAPGLLEALSVLVSATPFSGTAVVSADDLLAYVAAAVAHPAYTVRFADELTTPGIRVPVTADSALWSEAVDLGRGIIWAHTYGAAYVDPDLDRPPDNIRYNSGDPRRVQNLAAVTTMPTRVSYDANMQSVSLGAGKWGPVSQAVYDYTVGGKNVIRSWFNYRKAVPGGKKTSPLDRMHLDAWPGEWSSEFTDLLTVLARLVQAEPAQAALLERILDGPLLNKSTLSRHNVRWPAAPRDRKPNTTPPVPGAETVTEHLF